MASQRSASIVQLKLITAREAFRRLGEGIIMMLAVMLLLDMGIVKDRLSTITDLPNGLQSSYWVGPTLCAVGALAFPSALGMC